MFKIWIWNRRYKFENQPRLEPRASDISKFELFHLNWIVKYIRYMYLSTSTMNNLLTACHALWNADVTLVCCMVHIVYFLWLLKIYFNTILSGTGRCKVYLERRERKLRRLNGLQVTQHACLVQNWSLKLYINFFWQKKIQIF